jgi:hypothetical protein
VRFLLRPAGKSRPARIVTGQRPPVAAGCRPGAAGRG